MTIDILSKVCPQWGEMVSYTCPLAQSVLLGRRMTWSSVQQDVPSVRIKGFTTEGGKRTAGHGEEGVYCGLALFVFRSARSHAVLLMQIEYTDPETAVMAC